MVGFSKYFDFIYLRKTSFKDSSPRSFFLALMADLSMFVVEKFKLEKT
jgi:hypothetical protein